MTNQRPPGGNDEPTHDPGHAGAGQPGARPAWVDPNRTQRYEPRRSIADRLRSESREPDPPSKQETALPAIGEGSTMGPAARPKVASSAQRRAAGRRSGGGVRLVGILAAVIVVGLAGGAAAAWFSGWRPSFLGTASTEPTKSTPDKPPATPEAKPGEPTTPSTPTPPPPAGDIARGCMTGNTELKAGAAACGFALDAQGALTFQGAKIAEKLTVGAGPAQRLTLYPMSPSRRFVFLRACDGANRCDAQRFVDTKDKKILDVKGAEGFGWVAWSPKEQLGLLGFRDGLTDTIAVVTTTDGKVWKTSVIRAAKNRYALVRAASLRWRDEESFSVEVKQCPLGKGRTRNAECEKDDDVKYRRRTLKLER